MRLLVSNECCAAALPRGETAAPPQGASLPPWCDTVPASGPRSLRSDRQPLPLCPGRDTSIHTSKGVARDDALLQEEMAAPPRGKSPSPLLDAMAASGTRNQSSGRRLLTLRPRTLLFPKERQLLHLRV